MKRLLARIILFTEIKQDQSYWDNFVYFLKAMAQLAPIAYLLNWAGTWFVENKQFFFFVCVMLFLNLWVGVWYHVKHDSFNWGDFWRKNMSMIGALIVTYFVLEMFRYTAGDNIAGDIFRVTIQLATLLYPGSKILKNVYLLTNKEFPHAFIMERLYRFEKTGNVADLVKTVEEAKKEEEEDLHKTG